MAAQPRKMDFDEFALHLGSVFDAMEREQHPIVVERAGRLYRIEPQGNAGEGIWAAYDPRRMREALRHSAGALAGINRAQLLTDFRAQRSQDSTGRPTQ